MRKNLLLILLVSFSFLTYSQGLSAVDTGKYSISLPEYWKKGNKIWKILNDNLPVISEELKDKELCGDDCNPKYIVAFEMTRPVVADHYLKHTISKDSTESWKTVYSNNFSFQASLLLLNRDGDLLTRFIIVDSTEVWPLYEKNPARPKAQKAKPQVTDPLPISNTRWSRREPTLFTNSKNYVIYAYEGASFSPKGNEPTESDLFTIVDRKIRAW